uniref:NADH-ubiquinone oxidoreductase chain 1 n=1 Tax=Gammarus fossarum TaxID=52638 RepID=A0A343CZR0_9CRUS|nr:NADH dehydrogenase subunit 1 [Gammarus fossarum]ARQ82010.1 NADH dehydrogenase subunit 1 [Gammarus fossarum]
MESLNTVLVYAAMIVMILLGVAFITLAEQKILGGAQIRVGPNYVGQWGIMQPFADAVKLLSKETMNSRVTVDAAYYAAPIGGLSLSLLVWCIYPFVDGGLGLSYGVFFFMCVSGLGVYPILAGGWSSNCKYSVLGSLRAVAQMISYEASLGMILLSLIWLSSSFVFCTLLESQYMVYNIFMLSPLGYIWLVSSLAETNRSPYDFAEGESELVSGFNTEYGSGGFVLIFMAEYGSILLMGVLFSVLFVSSYFGLMAVLKGIGVVFVFIWVRASLPRYRYDKLMKLAWKSFLPVSLLLFGYYLWVGFTLSYC